MQLYHAGRFTGARINWEKDTLYFNVDFKAGQDIIAQGEDWRKKCRRLALGRGAFYGIAFSSENKAGFEKLVNMQELVVVLDASDNLQVDSVTKTQRTLIKIVLAPADGGCKKANDTARHLLFAVSLNSNIATAALKKVDKGSDVSTETSCGK